MDCVRGCRSVEQNLEMEIDTLAGLVTEWIGETDILEGRVVGSVSVWDSKDTERRL